MPRSTRKGLYRVIYLVGGRRATVPATLQFDAAMREFAALKRRGFTTWIESDSGEFVPVEGAMRKPKEIVDEHRVADFNSIPELIEHAKGEGASAILVAGQQVTLYFPRRDGRYDAATIWNQNGYWHAPSKSARTIVTRLPAGAESIGSHTQRVGRRAGEAPRRRLSRPNLKMTPESALQLAGELSQAVGGSKPRTLPGGYRFSDKNEAAQFTTYSPEYNQKVVCVVSVFEDGSTAIGIFSDEGLSGTATYENIAHFTYDGADIPVMKKDIEWVWETVDGYAASWQDDEGGEVDEARHIGLEPMSATAFIELISSLQPADRQTRIRFDPSLAGERGGGSVYVNFINLPPGIGGAGGGAEAENNRASFHVRGFAHDPTIPVSKVKVEQSNNVFRRTVPFRARTGSPEVVARHISAYLANVVATVPPHFTHTARAVSETGKIAKRFRVGDRVKMSPDALENYGEDYRDYVFTVVHVATKYMPSQEFFAKGAPQGYHPGFDPEGGSAIYDLNFDNGQSLPHSLYDWELEPAPTSTKSRRSR